MNIKHYGQFLSSAGKTVKTKSFDIEIRMIRIEKLKKNLKTEEDELRKMETEFYEFIKNDWSEEEISEAKKVLAEVYN